MDLPILSITIDIDPNIFTIGSLVLTWHGFFTLVAVATATVLVARWGKQQGLDSDSIYTVAIWAIIGGIVFSRLTHVIDRWGDIYTHDPLRALEIWSGGVTIYGAILGGFLTGGGYMLIRNHPGFLARWNKLFPGKLEPVPLPPVGRLADIAVPALLIAMMIGRIGDIINGEHVARLTSLPWGVIYAHSNSPSNWQHGLAASHPAVVYEMLWNLGVLGIVWPLRNRLRPYGMLFAMYLSLYSIGKFLISFLRIGTGSMDKEWVWSMGEAHFIALAVLAVTVPILLYKAQLVQPQARPRRPQGGDGGEGTSPSSEGEGGA
jgi:phosphatidylglycerol:prolipoprotein diacylglycerol transferase